MDKKTALIVEDVDISRRMLCNILNKKYNVIEACDGAQALGILEKCGNEIDIIISDIIMPIMDGFELLEHINKNKKLHRIPVIFCTEAANEKNEERALSLGVVDFIGKPYSPSQIIQRADNIIALTQSVNEANMLMLKKIANEKEIEHKLFETVINNSNLLYWEYDIATKRLYRSKRVQSVTGIGQWVENAPDYFIDEGYIHPDYVEPYRELYDRVRHGENAEAKFMTKYADGEYGWMNISYTVLFDSDSKPYKAMGIGTDISAQKETEQQLAISKRIITCARELMDNEDTNNAINTVLSNALEYYKAARSYIFELDFDNFIGINTYEQCAPGVSKEIDNLKAIPMEYLKPWIQAFTQNGYICIKDVTLLDDTRSVEREILASQNIRSLIAIPFYTDNRISGFVGVDDPLEGDTKPDFLMSISYFISAEIAKYKMRKKLSHMSYHDRSTGLYNRNKYTEFIDLSTKKQMHNVGVVFADINDLKLLNDTYGHSYGDSVISNTADIILRVFDSECCYHISGDEFVVICENISCDEFEKMTADLEKHMVIEGRSIAACGHIWSDVVTDLEQLVAKADSLMYLKKQHHYASHIDDKRKPHVLRNILNSIDNGRLVIYLQSKTNVSDGDLCGAEVLVRYNDVDHGILPPSKFIPLIEREKAISYVDFFVLEETCKTIQRWDIEGKPPIIISVNFSRVTLMEENCLERTMEICDKYSIPYSRIEIELTESTDSIDKRLFVNAINKLRKSGFRVALDDFGADYASMEMLLIAQLNVVKLDKRLIDKVVTSNKNRIVVQHIIDMTHELGMQCLAEGVETEQQLELLKSMGCDSLQGYLVSKPISVNEFEEKFL